MTESTVEMSMPKRRFRIAFSFWAAIFFAEAWAYVR